MNAFGGAAPDRQPATASERRVAVGGAEESAATEPWVSAAEVAAHLAVTEFWVREMARSAEIPGVKIGAYWRFRLSDIDAAMEARQSLRSVRRK